MDSSFQLLDFAVYHLLPLVNKGVDVDPHSQAAEFQDFMEYECLRYGGKAGDYIGDFHDTRSVGRPFG